jgi:hypothetical protein
MDLYIFTWKDFVECDNKNVKKKLLQF